MTDEPKKKIIEDQEIEGEQYLNYEMHFHNCVFTNCMFVESGKPGGGDPPPGTGGGGTGPG